MPFRARTRRTFRTRRTRGPRRFASTYRATGPSTFRPYRRKFRPRKTLTQKLAKYKRTIPFPVQGKGSARGYMRLPYVTTGTLTLNGTTEYSKEYVFRASLYDPDYSLGGHQPFGYDQVAAFWSHYTVDWILVEVEFHSESAHGGFTGYIRAGDDETSASTTLTIDDSMERGLFAKSFSARPQITAVGEGKLYRIKKLFNVSRWRHKLDKDQYSAAIGANPSDVQPFLVGVCINALQALTVYAHIRFTQFATLRGPKALAAS